MYGRGFSPVISSAFLYGETGGFVDVAGVAKIVGTDIKTIVRECYAMFDSRSEYRKFSHR